MVGQGLAGTVLSSYLMKNKIDHVIIDNYHHSSSTKAAAGLINPITGRNYVKSWMIDELLEEARLCYTHLEKLLSVDLIRETVILRSLNNAKEINKWFSSTGREGYSDYLDEDTNDFHYSEILNSNPKFGVIKQAFQIDISTLIVRYQDYLKSKDQLILEKFDHEKLIVIEGGYRYGNNEFSKIIFCEGYQAINNKYFNKLPFQLAKGEALELNFEDFNSTQILRDEIILVPLPNGSFWSGGGYLWDFDDDKPTQIWKDAWDKKLNNILNIKYHEKEHKAGICPCVKGRRPLIGEHKHHANMFIFNGMGTKGTSLAPFWARHFVEQQLINNQVVDSQVDINRFEY